MRLFVRHDRYERFVSCLVFLPRDRFHTQNRERIQEILREEFEADSVDFELRLSESVLVRIHYTVRVPPGQLPAHDARQIEARIVAATRAWNDELEDALVEEFGEEAGTGLFRRYGRSFPAGYRDDWLARSAVADVRRLEALSGDDGLGLSLYRPLEAPAGILRCKLYRRGERVSLSDVLPMFESMGLEVLDERPYRVAPREGPGAWIYDLGLHDPTVTEIDADAIRERFHDGFARVWHGDVEQDGFNGLIIRAGLDAREVTLLRAVARYVRQAGIAFSDSYMERTLMSHADVAASLVALFRARFDPAHERRDEAADKIAREIDAAIDSVASLDEDRILRSFYSVIGAMLRTNFFQPGAGRRAQAVPLVQAGPGARCRSSPRRGRVSRSSCTHPGWRACTCAAAASPAAACAGPIAARTSARRSSGLMKAQMVKNALIVPVGAKGGFVVKRPPAGREALLEEVVACYRTFISGLLDVTDTIADGAVVPPRDVVRHDGDDPYLVVAADKGTATFSDTANAIAQEYGFWLGDAFASGGSVGYDHKAMGITARSAWVSVARHFRELGIDIQSTEFTVAGIGDMSGDVFGNGMLLSPHIRLVGGVRPSPHLPRPGSGCGRRIRGATPAVRASALVLGGLRQVADLRGRRRVAAHRQVDPAVASGPERAGRRGRAAGAERAHPGDSARAGRPAVERWHRDVRQGHVGDACRRRRQGQRRGARRRVPAALPRRRRGRQPRLHAARAGRVRALRRRRQHGRDRQRGRRQLLRPRGEHQDPARLGGRGRRPDRQAAQRAAGRDDRGGGRARAARQLHPDPGAQPGACAGAGDARRPRPPDAQLRAGWAARPRARGAARRRDDRRAPHRRPRAGATRAGGDPRLQQDHALRGAAGLRPARGCRAGRRSRPLLPRAPAGALRRPHPAAPPAPRDRRHPRDERHGRPCRDHVRRSGCNEDTGAPPSDIARAYAVARDVFDVRSLWAEVEALDLQVAATTQIGMLLDSRRLVERATRWLLRSSSPAAGHRRRGGPLRRRRTGGRRDAAGRARAG